VHYYSPIEATHAGPHGGLDIRDSDPWVSEAEPSPEAGLVGKPISRRALALSSPRPDQPNPVGRHPLFPRSGWLFFCAGHLAAPGSRRLSAG